MERDVTDMQEHRGNPFGSHRVIEPQGALPQPALKIDNTMERIWDNEILVDVDTLNVDSASFAQIKRQAAGDPDAIKRIILDIVGKRGKLQNPVTGSGGIFTGTVSRIGEGLRSRDLEPGDRIASLVSLSLTPLRIDGIHEVKQDVDQVTVSGQAILFESGIYSKLPDDMPSALAMAVLDVCGAPAQTARLVKPGDTVVILGATGKSGILCAHVARKCMGANGMLIGLGHSENKCRALLSLSLCDEVVRVDASDALGCYELISRMTDGRMADLVVNCVNIPNTEMASILMCREEGTIYFFSMATSFTKAALGAEGVGKDVSMIIGNGYVKGHAELALDIVRESNAIRTLYESLYC
jgi:L-erythro-3,5-diaminohexanoate dehydrogenase